MPMTRWLLFVKSHESEAATTQSACPSEMRCFFVRVFLTSRWCRVFPHRGAVDLLKSSIVLPDSQAHRLAAS